MTASKRDLLRDQSRHDSGKVGMIELFFDLVFVFAVTQLSHLLVNDLTAGGALRVALLLPAVWWVWIYTSWTTNWLDPERIPVRVCLFALMAGGLMLSASIPDAFENRGVAFAFAYVFMQIGRTLFVLWALRHAAENMRRNFQRIVAWLALAGACWIAGGFASGDARFAWWMAALLIELIAPAAFFWVPGLGRSTIADWNIDGAHMAERCALFVIIALGESILVTGATFAELPWSPTTFAAFAFAFLGSVAMWWLYFDTGAERAAERIKQAHDPGRQGRLAYTYLHLLIVAGIIVCAVADEIVLQHPGHVETPGVAAILGGPALYLLGTASFKWVTNDRRGPPLSHLIGLLLLLGLAPFAFAHVLSALALAAATTAILVLVAAWETLALRRSAAPTQP